MSGHATALGAGQIRIDERVGFRFSVSERDGKTSPAPAEPRPGLLDCFFYNNQQNGMCEWVFTESVEVALKEQDNSYFFYSQTMTKLYLISITDKNQTPEIQEKCNKMLQTYLLQDYF
jgi:hypothetical protein